MDQKTEIKLTDSQLEAVNQDLDSIVVRAGAGSGKTLVLVRRYLRLVLQEQLKPHQILAVTFTEKAAAEMAERIATGFAEADRPDLIADLNSAPIGTLHSFCSRIVSPHALPIGIDPGYSILDQHESDILKEECLTKTLKNWRLSRPDDIRTLVRKLSWKGDFGLRRGISPASRGFARQFIQYYDRLRAAGWQGKEPFCALDVSVETIKADIEILRRTWSALKMETSLNSRSKELMQNIGKSLSRCDEALNGGRELLPPVLDEFSRISLSVQPVIKKFLSEIKNDLTPKLLSFHYQKDYDSVRFILNSLYRDFNEIYGNTKRDAGRLDFSDLEEYALKILEDDPEQQLFDRILIDETQDLNAVQWNIINRLAENTPLFIVGDAQQSIYGFRFADVALFKDHIAQVEKSLGNVIDLAENFRSRESIIAAVNRLFSQLWKEREGQFLKLKAERDDAEANDSPVELLFTTADDRSAARQKEAEMLANRLKTYVNTDGYSWGDILVLVRASTSVAYLEEAFNQAEIPVTVQSGRGFWDAMEICDLLALLSCLENPGDDFNLACLLKSPGVDFSDDELVRLRSVEANGLWKRRPIFTGVEVTANTDIDDPLRVKCSRFLSIFNDLFQQKDLLFLRKLFDRWIEAYNLEAYWASVKEGDYMRANVQKFLRLCDQYQGESALTLRSLFEDLRVRDVKEGAASTPAANRSAVQILTVHSAKGLEAPIVAIFDMNAGTRSQTDPFVFQQTDQGYFSLRSDQKNLKDFKPVEFEAIVGGLKERSEQEEERILYVAMTRARDRLLLSASGTENKGKIRTEGWFNVLANGLQISTEMILNNASVESGLINKHGEETGIMLRREVHPSDDFDQLVREDDQSATEVKLPDSFPQPPLPRFAPVSVSEFLTFCFPTEETGFKGDEGDKRESTKGIDPVDWGSWLHKLLEGATGDPAVGFDREKVRLFGQRILHRTVTDPEIDLAISTCSRFYASKIGQDLLSSKRKLHEFPLLFKVGDLPLRGKIDLMYETDLGWILIDFKSDQRLPNKQSIRWQKYEMQLQLYALSWKLLTGTLPKAAYLSFLTESNAIQIDLEETAFNHIRHTASDYCDALLSTNTL